jgi:hypothetical protein
MKRRRVTLDLDAEADRVAVKVAADEAAEKLRKEQEAAEVAARKAEVARRMAELSVLKAAETKAAAEKHGEVLSQVRRCGNCTYYAPNKSDPQVGVCDCPKQNTRGVHRDEGCNSHEYITLAQVEADVAKTAKLKPHMDLGGPSGVSDGKAPDRCPKCWADDAWNGSLAFLEGTTFICANCGHQETYFD